MKNLILLLICVVALFTSAKAQNPQIKIFVVRDTVPLWDKKYPSEIYWGFYKVDFIKSTIQFKAFGLRGGDLALDITNVSSLFKDCPKSYFDVKNGNTLKVARISGTRIKRAWNDFATAGRTASTPAKIFELNADTLKVKNGDLKYVYDKNLTAKYNREQNNR